MSEIERAVIEDIRSCLVVEFGYSPEDRDPSELVCRLGDRSFVVWASASECAVAVSIRDPQDRTVTQPHLYNRDSKLWSLSDPGLMDEMRDLLLADFIKWTKRIDE